MGSDRKQRATPLSLHTACCKGLQGRSVGPYPAQCNLGLAAAFEFEFQEPSAFTAIVPSLEGSRHNMEVDRNVALVCVLPSLFKFLCHGKEGVIFTHPYH